MDETYIKVKGKWHYFYRAVGTNGATVDLMLSPRHDGSAAKAFFTKSIGSNGISEKITIDKSGANLAGLNAINFQIAIQNLLRFSMMQIHIRQIKYLNNIIEKDHRGIKEITNPMMGFKDFHSAEATLAGIELCRMIKKGQHIEAKNSSIFKQF